MAAITTPTPVVVPVVTVPLVKGTETLKTVRFIEAGKEAKTSQALLWIDKSVLALLGVEDAADLTVTIAATKTEPGITVFPPLEVEPAPVTETAPATKPKAKAKPKAAAKPD